MNEEELLAKEDEIKRREEELQKKEEALSQKEAELGKREIDASAIAQTIKQEYDAKMDAQKQEFELRLKQRDDVIRQLANGENTEDESGAFAELNRKRRLQKSA